MSALPRLAWLPLLGLLGLASCVHRAPLARFDAPTPISVVVLLDTKSGTQLQGLPPEIATALGHELERRNLVAETPAAEALAPLGQNRNPKTRAELLAAALGPHRAFLLVELKADFFGQFDGGYKWTVSGQLTVAQTDALVESNAATLGIPVFLERESEGEHEALIQAAADLAERAGALLDDHFAGRLAATAAAASPPEPGK